MSHVVGHDDRLVCLLRVRDFSSSVLPFCMASCANNDVETSEERRKKTLDTQNHDSGLTIDGAIFPCVIAKLRKKQRKREKERSRKSFYINA